MTSLIVCDTCPTALRNVHVYAPPSIRSTWRIDVHPFHVADLDARRHHAHSVRRRHFLVVLVPRDERLRRGGGVAEQLDRVAVLVDEERRRDMTEYRRRCNQSTVIMVALCNRADHYIFIL